MQVTRQASLSYCAVWVCVCLYMCICSWVHTYSCELLDRYVRIIVLFVRACTCAFVHVCVLIYASYWIGKFGLLCCLFVCVHVRVFMGAYFCELPDR